MYKKTFSTKTGPSDFNITLPLAQLGKFGLRLVSNDRIFLGNFFIAA